MGARLHLSLFARKHHNILLETIGIVSSDWWYLCSVSPNFKASSWMFCLRMQQILRVRIVAFHYNHLFQHDVILAPLCSKCKRFELVSSKLENDNKKTMI